MAAALVQRAVGDQLTCVFVDHGLLRQGEAEQVEQDFVAATGVDLKVVDAQEQFLGFLDDVTDPEHKRKIIGREFIRTFEAAEREIVADAEAPRSSSSCRARCTRTSSSPAAARARPTSRATTTSAGCRTTSQFRSSSRSARCSRTRSVHVGDQLGLPPAIVWRHPFPGPGLAIRIIGAVDRKRLDILREADAIAREEITAAGLDDEIWQFPVVLLADVRSVGVQGDGRTYGHPIVLRPVSSEDAMTADWSRLPYELLERISTRITNEVAGRQPRGARHHQQAARHHRVGVTSGSTGAAAVRVDSGSPNVSTSSPACSSVSTSVSGPQAPTGAPSAESRRQPGRGRRSRWRRSSSLRPPRRRRRASPIRLASTVKPIAGRASTVRTERPTSERSPVQLRAVKTTKSQVAPRTPIVLPTTSRGR